MQEISRDARLTVIMPNFNDSHFLAEALGAVRDEAAGKEKIFFIDDASSDDSVEVARRVLDGQSNAEIRINPRNQGVVATLNEALARVTTPYVYFAASNDRVARGFFTEALTLLSAYPQAALCSGLIRFMNEEGRPLGPMRTPIPLSRPGFLPPETVARELVQRGEWIVGAATFYRTEDLQKLGGFDPKLFGATDSISAICMALQKGACFTPRIAAWWRLSTQGYATRSTSDWNLVRQIIGHGAERLRPFAGRAPTFLKRWRAERLYWYFRDEVRNGQTARALANLAEVERLPYWAVGLMRLPFPRRLSIVLGALVLTPFKFPRVLRSMGQWIAQGWNGRLPQ